jgi:Protein of unknown function (DUF455)
VCYWCAIGVKPRRLWESAASTAHSLPARLAIESCVHEARGLDVLPSTIRRFESGGDTETASLLRDVIYQEEVSHCAVGVRWLQFLHCRAAAAVKGTVGSSGTSDGSSSSSNGCAQQQPDAFFSNAASPVAAAAAAADPPAVLDSIQDWLLDAARHATVQDWFHSLVRQHFKGNLKVGFFLMHACV